MAIDWDAELLGPVMAVFGEGQDTDPSSWPVYYFADGTTFAIPDAVYDDQYTRVDALGEGVTESTTHPVLGIRDAVFAPWPTEPRQGAIIYLPSAVANFRVVDVQRDGHGHTLLIMMRAKA